MLFVLQIKPNQHFMFRSRSVSIKNFILIVILVLSKLSFGQSTFLATGNEWNSLVSRMEIKSGKSAPRLHSALRPLERKAIVDFLLQIDSTPNTLSRTDRQLISLFLMANGEWYPEKGDSVHRPLLRNFYKVPTDLLRYHDDEFFLVVNPVVHFEVGRENGRDSWLYQNTRGAEVRGMINQKVGFYSLITDNQARFPLYVNRKIGFQQGAIPGEGWNIPFGNGGYDYFTARGYIAFQATRNIGIQFGHDKNFIGHGQRSLFLSDYANNYLFLKVNTRVWKLHYQNLFARMVDYPQRSFGGRIYDAKYMVAHTLSANITQRLQIGLFESVVFGRTDTLSRRGFDPHYLNPIIFYRAIEHHIGDPDKVALGFMWRYIAGRSLAFHGQVYIDDFLLSDVRNDLDSLLVRLGLRKERKYTQFASFRNKFGLQLGLNYVDVAGIDNLDMLMEACWVRPFTYSHYDTSGAGLPPSASYTHYGQALAHPLGANFREFIVSLQYQPHRNWLFKTTLISASQGMDAAGVNLGSNIYSDYTTRTRDYGHTFLQGDLRSTLILQPEISWQWWPGMWLDARYVIRDQDYLQATENTSLFMLGSRINADRRDMWF